MGTNFSGTSSLESERNREKPSKVFFLLNRTWAVIVTDKWTKTRLSKTNCNDSISGSELQYSFCSCSECREDVSTSCSRLVFSFKLFFNQLLKLFYIK